MNAGEIAGSRDYLMSSLDMMAQLAAAAMPEPICPPDFRYKISQYPPIVMKKRFYESTIALNIAVIHNKNNFSFHTPLEKHPAVSPRVFFLFID
jgi:hypothetical protein